MFEQLKQSLGRSLGPPLEQFGKSINHFLNQPKMIIAPSLILISFIIYLIGISNIFYGIGTIASIILMTINTLFSGILIPLLTIIVSLLYVLTILIIPMVALIITALFTCPSQESFSTWTKEFIAFAIHEQMDQPKQTISTESTESNGSTKSTEPIKPTESKSLWESAMGFTNKYIVVPLAPTLLSKYVFKTPSFMYCGFFRIATCKTNDEKKMIFLGVFNTWVPIK